MDEVTIRDLRNHGGEVMDRVEHGETVIVTRSGVPVGELRPVPRQRVSGEVLLARWRSVPVIDASALRADVDAILDSSL